MVDKLVAIHRSRYEASGVELTIGEGQFDAPKTIEVRLPDDGTRLLAGERVFLSVGTRTAIPAVPGLKHAAPLTHVDALELNYPPDHLIVLGGGYVELELAQPMRRFGSRVTVVGSTKSSAHRRIAAASAISLAETRWASLAANVGTL